MRTVLLRMLVPPVLRSGNPGNKVLELEREFEGQVAELQTHCNVADPANLSTWAFWHRVGYFEGMMRAKVAAVQ